MKVEGSELLECKAYAGGDHVTSTFLIHEPHRKTPLAIFFSFLLFLSLLRVSVKPSAVAFSGEA